VEGRKAELFMDASIINLTVRLEIATKRDGGEWVAWCPPLDVFSQGRSKRDAIASLKEAVELWFESCIQRGVLDKALREVGFKRVKPGDKPSSGASIVRVQARDTKPGAEFASGYIDVSVPAYVAAHLLETNASRRLERTR
jgi:predicted RNase H-like HicB family nuclease